LWRQAGAEKGSSKLPPAHPRALASIIPPAQGAGSLSDAGFIRALLPETRGK